MDPFGEDPGTLDLVPEFGGAEILIFESLEFGDLVEQEDLLVVVCAREGVPV